VLEFDAVFRMHGGLARRAHLLAHGFTGAQLTRAVRRGMIRRVRVGWYMPADADEHAALAVAIGGTLACISAAKAHGLWVPQDLSTLHVSLPANASRLRGVGMPWIAHWTEADGRPERPVATVQQALLDVAMCQPVEIAVAVWDSALNMNLVRLTELRSRTLSRRARAVLALCDMRAESGIETITRLRLVAAGHPPEVQVRVAPGVRVDLLIARVVIELDGSAFHSGVTEFERDRARDAVLNAWGYRVLHFSYRQVMSDWETVIATIRMVMRQHPVA